MQVLAEFLQVLKWVQNSSEWGLPEFSSTEHTYIVKTGYEPIVKMRMDIWSSVSTLRVLCFLLFRWWRKPRLWWRMLRRRWIAWERKGRQTGMCLIWSPSTYSLGKENLVKRTGDSVLLSWSSLVGLLFVSCLIWYVFTKLESKSVNWKWQWNN